MKIAIVGYDLEGQSSYRYYGSKSDNQITILDQKTDVQAPEGAESVLGETYLDDLSRFDLIVRTAGLPPKLILDKNPGLEAKITSQVNEFLQVCPTRNIIGVTGTKGKGTTSTLIAKMLEASGKDVAIGGNIGVPMLDLLPKLTADSWVVLELSSFQLIDLTAPAPHIAVCLMVVPEHLNWHDDLDEYREAKSQLFSHQTAEDIAIYFAGSETSKQIASSSPGRKLAYYSEPGAHIENDAITIEGQIICSTSELKLLGQHNWQNVCAAVTAAWQISQDVESMKSVLTSFSGLPHRLELVRELDEVEYYDDSFGTTPETAIVALKAFDQPKISILGGSDKGASYDELAETVKTANVRKVLLIGDEAPKIQAALGAVGFDQFMPGGQNMTEIVANARREAKPGDVVLLSTGCASFGMFKNYKDRAKKFIEAVQALV